MVGGNKIIMEDIVKLFFPTKEELKKIRRYKMAEYTTKYSPMHIDCTVGKMGNTGNSTGITPPQPPVTIKKSNFKWVLYANKFRQKRKRI